MKIAYKKFINSPKINEYPIYLLLGNPYHLQNEVQSRLEYYFKNKDYLISKYLVDADFNLDLIKDDFENYSLFSQKKVVLLNIISNTIPKTISDYLIEKKDIPDLVVILKLSSQSPSFKKNKLYSKIDSKGCIIEFYELSGSSLIEWVRRKFAKNNISYTEELFKKLIDKNEGNTSAISQELYKMSLLDIQDIGVYFDFIQKEYKFTEYDLVDSIIDKDINKSLKILSYLRSIKSSEVYVLFLINNEIKKIYYLVNELSPSPYIVSFKRSAYNNFAINYSNQHLMDLMQYCYAIDKSIKLGISQVNTWHNFEILVTAFIMKKPFSSFIDTELA